MSPPPPTASTAIVAVCALCTVVVAGMWRWEKFTKSSKYQNVLYGVPVRTDMRA